MPHVNLLTLVILGHSMSITKEIVLKNDPRVPPFKVTQGHRNQPGSIDDLWFPVIVPYQPQACLVLLLG